jgi:hypothetical protein
MTRTMMTRKLSPKALDPAPKNRNLILNKDCFRPSLDPHDGADKTVGSVYSLITLAGQGRPTQRIAADNSAYICLFIRVASHIIWRLVCARLEFHGICRRNRYGIAGALGFRAQHGLSGLRISHG